MVLTSHQRSQAERITATDLKQELSKPLSSIDRSLPGFEDFNVITKWDCLNVGSEYLAKDSTFDNLGNAIKVLFSIS